MKKFRPNRFYTQLVNADAIDDASKLLATAFPWDYSEEGFKFWQDVHNRLIALRDNARLAQEYSKTLYQLREKHPAYFN